MKIAQINEVCGYGSTGSICKEISEYLNSKGVENLIFYGQKYSTYRNSRKFGFRLGNLIHSVFYTRILGLHGFGSFLNTISLIKQLKKFNPDIIHLHSLHTNYINYPLLYNYIHKSGLPVVMTLHDCYNFTGQCEHYVGVNCTRFKDGCGNCPFIHKTIAPSLVFDWSNWLLAQKKQWYEAIHKMTVVAVSKWLEKEASQSILVGAGHRITYIYNWVDTDVFFPRPTNELEIIRNKYSLKYDIRYIIAVSAQWDKCSSKYEDIIALCKLLPEKYKLIVVGGVSSGTDFPNSIVHINYIEDPNELACLYSIAYAYLHVSVCEAFGKVIAEAMACGTTPIVYNSTACSEVADVFGVAVKPHDIIGIVGALELMANDTDAMIAYVRENYNKHNNLQKYLEVYNTIKI